jgi:hypothetical protein
VLDDARGGPPRTSPAFFGKGPLATGPAPKLLEPPPELAALAIEGLEPGPGSRDRWPYLVLCAEAAAEVGPIEYRAQVPGYRPAEARLYARPVLGRLHEERVILEPVADEWGELAVQIVGAPLARDLEIPDDELVAAVRLVRGGDDPWDLRIVRFAVHARALRAPEPIGALPTGEYEVVLEAEDSGYETEPTPLRVLPGHQTLTFDARDAGLLLLDLRAGRALHDGRCALRIDDAQGGHFYSTFDRAPYVVPFLVPGRYVLSEIDAPGCAVLAPETPFEIFPGELTVELATCEPASGGGEPR